MLVHLPAQDPKRLLFGRRLHDVRLARGVDIAWLSERAGVSKTTLGLVEQGRSSLSSAELHRVTNALGLPLTFLVTEGGDLTRLRRF